jgi:hypothetical protein
VLLAIDRIVVLVVFFLKFTHDFKEFMPKEISLLIIVFILFEIGLSFKLII